MFKTCGFGTSTDKIYRSSFNDLSYFVCFPTSFSYCKTTNLSTTIFIGYLESFSDDMFWVGVLSMIYLIFPSVPIMDKRADRKPLLSETFLLSPSAKEKRRLF